MSSIKYCESCGKEHDGTYGSGRFCSRACANRRSQTAEANRKRSEAVKLAFIKYEEQGCTCEKCGKIFHTKDYSRKLCFECQPTTIKHTKGKENPTSIKDVSKRTASKIFKRMELPCSNCGFYIKGVVWDIHHIVPRSKGGTNDMNNLTYICPNCHRIAHTDVKLLTKPLVSMYEQMENCGKDWRDYYYG